MDNKITVENLEMEINRIEQDAPLNCVNLERLVLYCKAKKYLAMDHEEFTEEDAKAWIARMKPAARWTQDQTTAVMRQHGYDHKPCEFWVVMNSLVSDYGDTMARYGLDRPDVWAEMAHDWLEDDDAETGKTERYFRAIVRH